MGATFGGGPKKVKGEKGQRRERSKARKVKGLGSYLCIIWGKVKHTCPPPLPVFGIGSGAPVRYIKKEY